MTVNVKVKIKYWKKKFPLNIENKCEDILVLSDQIDHHIMLQKSDLSSTR